GEPAAPRRSRVSSRASYMTARWPRKVAKKGGQERRSSGANQARRPSGRGVGEGGGFTLVAGARLRGRRKSRRPRRLRRGLSGGELARAPDRVQHRYHLEREEGA